MSDEKPTIDALSRLLADTYALYTKTHGFHLNVTGPMFTSLHTLFETQYLELALAVDEIAERVRTLGAPAPGSWTQFGELMTLTEATSVPKATAMVEVLVADQAKVVASAKKALEAAEDAGDAASADLATRRIDVHQKAAWMLRSHLE